MMVPASFLLRQPFAQGLQTGEMQRLSTLFEVRRYRAGEVMVAEGAPFGALCLIHEGRARVSKRGPGAGDVVLSGLEPGAMFGEMSFLDEQAASATVQAETDCVVLSLDRSRLDAVRDPLATRPREQLLAHASRAAVSRLRAMGGAFAEESRRRVDLSRFLVMIVLLFGLGNVVQRVITPDLPPAVHMAWSWGLLLVIVALCGRFIRQQHAPLAAFGLTRTGLRPALIEGAAAGVGLLGLGVAWRLATVDAGESFVSLGSVGTYGPAEQIVFFAAYPLHCFLQELVARGVIQGSLERLLGEARPAAGTLVTALMFAIFHLHVSVSFAAITFVASLGFGALYRRHGNLWGVTVTHLCVGLGSLLLGMN